MTLPIKPRRGRPRSQSDDARRDSIAQVATEMFSQHGYARTTTEDVAAACGISKQTLYRLFPSKIALFAAVVDAHRSTMLDFSGTEGLSDAEALARVFRVDIDAEADHARSRLFRVVIAESVENPELGQTLLRHGGEKARAELGAWLASRDLLGPGAAEPDLQASILLNMMFGTPIAKQMGEVGWPGGNARRTYMRHCIALFLEGARR